VTLLAQTRLLQMTSQAFPIGGYSHSQGLESAIEAGIVTDESSVEQWILDVFEFTVCSYELPLLARFGAAWCVASGEPVAALNADYLATRESAELRRASVQMGYSLRVLLDVLPELPPDFLATLRALVEPSLPCVWSGAAAVWSIDPRDSMMAYAWVWAENQVLVAIKSVPLGQASGQRILLKIGARIAKFVQDWDYAQHRPLSNFAPGLAILSSQHETQYSRLFRS
jgi:urease accessory protein